MSLDMNHIPATTDGGLKTVKASVYLNAATNTTTAGWQKIPIDTVQYDTGGIWQPANLRFVPNIPGYYSFNLRVRTNTTANLVAGIGFNGVQTFAVGDDVGTSAFALGGTGLIFCNGTTDYLELFAFTTTARALTAGNAFDTYMQVIGPM